MYPILENNVCVWVEVDEETLEEEYYASNAAGKEFKLAPSVYDAVRSADGTRPLQLSEQALRQLIRNRILRTRRLSLCGPASTFTLFPVGSRAESLRPFLRLVNMLLPPLSVLLFALGACLTWNAPARGFHLSLWSYAGLMVLSVLLHEFGHFAAAVSAGCRVYEVGIFLFFLIPCGAYVSYEANHKRLSPGQNLQIALAGVEWNLLLCGLFSLCAVCSETMGFTLFLAAINNFILAAVNLLPGDMLDGGQALGALLSVEDIYASSKQCFPDRQYRRQLLRSGPAGLVCYAIFAVGYLSRGISLLVVGGNIALSVWMLLL